MSTPTTIGELMLVGLRVTYRGDYCNHPGEGVIVGTHAPDRFSRGEVDIVLDDGRKILRYSVHLLRVHGDDSHGSIVVHVGHYADEPEIAEFNAKAAIAEADERAQATLAAETRIRERETMRASFPFLEPDPENQGTTTLAAKNLRKAFKHYLPGSKFSVRVSRGAGCSAIDVRWTGPADPDRVDEICAWFKSGWFDSQIDSYNYETTAFTDVFGGARYVFASKQRD
jgi:hypothetical protein